MRKILSFLSIVFLLNFAISQQITPDMVIPVCDNQSISTGAPSNTGVYNLTIPCGTQPLSSFMDFYYVKILSGTTFTFKVTPIGQDDYDFGAYKNPNWNNIQATPAADKRGSQNDPFQTMTFTLGLSLTATDLCETGGSTGIPEPGMVRYFNVTAGDEILIAIDRWSQTTLGYTLEFGGDAVLDCTVLGNSYGKCDIDNDDSVLFSSSDFIADLNQDFPNHTFKYYYNQSDAEANNNNFISFPLTVNYNNGDATEIFVRVETQNGAFVRILKIFLYVNKIPQLLTETVELPLACDENGDGEAVFDLTQTESQFVDNPGDFTIRYYTTGPAAAAGGTNNISNPTAYQTGNTTIYVRIETGPADGNEAGCYVITTIDINVSDFYVEEKTIETEGVCDNDGDGSASVDLTENITEIVTDPAAYQISYHQNLADAENGANPIANPENYTISIPGSTTVFVRIQSATDLCYSISKLIYNTTERPVLNSLDEVSLCDDQQEGSIGYDLTQFENLITDVPADYEFSYFETANDAQNGTNPIPNPGNFQLPINTPTEIFIRVEANGCFNIGSVMITISSNPLLNENREIGVLCDEDGDGVITVDLTENDTYFLDNSEDFQISYHTTEQDAVTGDNPINNPDNFEINAGETITVYIRVKSETGDCYSVRSVTYTTAERPILNDLEDISICSDEQEGSIAYDLTGINIIDNPQNYVISYYESANDAQNQTNPILNPDSYPVPLNSEITIYIRVSANDCFNIGNLKILISSNPLLNENREIGPLCEEENGIVTVDLTENDAYFINDPEDFQISYHTTEQDATTGDNPINNPDNFVINAGETVTVYIRVKSPDSDCYSVRSITYYTNQKLVLNEMDDVVMCVDDQGEFYIYDLTQLDVIQNPQDYEISYYLSLEDANLGENPIVNPETYQVPMNQADMTSVFIRVVKETCFSVAEVQFWINSNPVVNSIDEQIFCTQQESGEIVYDLTQHQSEWMGDPTGFDFEYYPSLADLENGSNQITNPENYLIPVGATTQIYIKIIHSNTGCYSTTVLTLEPGSRVELNQGIEIELCDDNFDGVFEYNLNTLNPLLIGNPAGLNFNYYLSLNDALNGENPIAENQISNFQFTAIPYSVWVTATTSDGCPSDPVKVDFIAGEEINLLSPVIGPLDYCQGEEFDLTAYETQMTDEDVSFNYFQNLNDAQNGLNPIANTTAYHPVQDNSVFVRIESEGRCATIAEIKFHLLPTPEITVNNDYIELCPGETFTAVAGSSDPNPSYEWYFNDILMGTDSAFEISQNGSYTVIVTGAEGCINQKTITVVSPPTPVITGVEMGQDYIIVTAGSGGGTSSVLEYSLDKIFWQNSPRFDNLIPGETYTVYVRQAGCMMDSYEFTLLLITNFISPNGDGLNDTWTIRGVEVGQGARLRIFDRYGKIFVDTSFGGNYTWNGKYMGRPVASDDYWYIIEIPGDQILKSKRFTGHISVRNQ